MTESVLFSRRAEIKAKDNAHRAKLGKAIRTYDIAVANMKSRQFSDWEAARRLAAGIKDYSIQNLPNLLESFEEKISARGAQVLWAEDASEARGFLIDILRTESVAKVVKSKSMTTEEIEVNELLENVGIDVHESDLGELIVQLAGEKPYHIVTPAMHKSIAEISELFHKHLGANRTDSPEELTAIARSHLRETFITADAGITGANFIVANDGSIVVTENEGNAILTAACPRIHIVIVGIEKVIPSLADLSLFLPLLATSGTGQRITCYNSIFRGPRQVGEVDGPEKMFVILLDNGRTRLFANENARESLRCIRCGACLNTCPVFKTVGGHAYNTVYQGPIGSVVTPHMKGLREWGHLSHASSLCGACTSVCPVKIDLHNLLLDNRASLVRANSSDWRLEMAMRYWARLMTRRDRVDRVMKVWKWIVHPFLRVLPISFTRSIPSIASESFSQHWRRHVESRNNH